MRDPRRRTDLFARAREAMFDGLEPRRLFSTLPIVTARMPDSFAAEELENGGRFVISRSGSTDEPLTVWFTIAGSATPGVDYVGLAGVVRIPAGRRAIPVPVNVIDDFDVEGPETVRLTLLPAQGKTTYVIDPANTGNTSIQMTIVDDDRLPEVTIASANPWAREVGPFDGRFTITRTGPTVLPLTVSFRIGGTARPGVDYVRFPSSVVIPVGSATVDVVVDAINDNDFEGNEAVRLTLLPDNDYLLTPDDGGVVKAVVRILDRPTVFVIATDDVASTSGDDTATITLIRTGPTDGALRVVLGRYGNARAGADYAEFPRALVFAPGESVITLEITGAGAWFSDPFRTLQLALEARPQYQGDLSNVSSFITSIRIYDDFVPPTR
jgi:hypothetical protein